MKTLRVRITDKEWQQLQPLLHHGDITRLFRQAVKRFIQSEADKKWYIKEVVG
jgi:hypothetical protein